MIYSQKGILKNAIQDDAHKSPITPSCRKRKVTKMAQNRLARMTLDENPKTRRPMGRPLSRWTLAIRVFRMMNYRRIY